MTAKQNKKESNNKIIKKKTISKSQNQSMNSTEYLIKREDGVTIREITAQKQKKLKQTIANRKPVDPKILKKYNHGEGINVSIKISIGLNDPMGPFFWLKYQIKKFLNFRIIIKIKVFYILKNFLCMFLLLIINTIY